MNYSFCWTLEILKANLVVLDSNRNSIAFVLGSLVKSLILYIIYLMITSAIFNIVSYFTYCALIYGSSYMTSNNCILLFLMAYSTRPPRLQQWTSAVSIYSTKKNVASRAQISQQQRWRSHYKPSRQFSFTSKDIRVIFFKGLICISKNVSLINS